MIRLKDIVLERQFWIATALTIILYCFDHFRWSDNGVTALLAPVRKETYSTLATLFGALFGFVITAFSIVLGLGHSKIMETLRSTGDSKRVTTAFIGSIYIVGAAAALSLAGIFADSSTTANRAFDYLLFFVSTWAALSLLGIAFIMETLVNAADGS